MANFLKINQQIAINNNYLNNFNKIISNIKIYL